MKKDLIHDHITPKYNSRAELRVLIENNINTRFLHHHVFNEEVISRVCSEAGFRVVLVSSEIFPEIIIMGEKYPERNIVTKPASEIILKY
jgi:hypothetical protein